MKLFQLTLPNEQHGKVRIRTYDRLSLLTSLCTRHYGRTALKIRADLNHID